jgi:hypothetical protein
MVNRLKVSILCLIETRVKQDKAQEIVNALVPGWDWINNYGTHRLGRIWICWNPGLTSSKLVSLHEQVSLVR